MSSDAPFQAIMQIGMHAMLADGKIEGDEQEMLRRTADAMGIEVTVAESVAELPPLEECAAALDDDGRQQAFDFAFHILICDDELDPAEEEFLSTLYQLVKPGDSAGAARAVEIARAYTQAERAWREFRSRS